MAKAKPPTIDSEGRLSKDISDFIDSVFAEPKQVRDLPEELKTKYKLTLKIAEAARSNMIFGRIPYHLDLATTESLIRLIRHYDLDHGMADRTFALLHSMLAADLGEMGADNRNRNRLEGSLEHLQFVAVSYFETELAKELKDTHIAEVLVRCEATLEEWEQAKGNGQDWFRQAVSKIKESTEKRVNRQKKQAEIHEAIKLFDFVEKAETDDVDRIPDKFSIKEAMVLLDYLATTPRVWAGSTHKAKAEFILRLSAHNRPSIDKIENMFSRANFDEIRTNNEGILNIWKERFLPSPKGRKQD